MYFLLICFFILCNKDEFASANPMHGIDVRQAYEGEFLFVAGIKRYNLNLEPQELNLVCTGVIISNFNVLTNAHCERFFENYLTEVAIGSHDIREGISRFASWWITYNRWAEIRNVQLRYESNDIAVIRLNQTIPEYIIPVPLTNLPDTNFFRSVVRVAAFGKTSTGMFSRFMETVELTIIARRECDHRVTRLRGRTFKVSQRYLCGVADPIALMSKGNSGAAVVLNNELIGIHKATCPSHENSYHPEKVNLIMSVDFYRQFITDIITNF